VKLVLGLGNPGRAYELTRHNVGWMVLDHLADVWRSEGWRKDGESRIADVRRGTTRVRLAKPQTFMNLSGAVLRPWLRREGWNPASDLLVVSDEVALPIGTYRLRASGSAGGHNGLRSIEGALDSQAYARLRIGIGPSLDPGLGRDLSQFVLGGLSRAEQRTIAELQPTFEQIVDLWVREGALAAMNAFNRKIARSPEPPGDTTRGNDD
jgi:PTH1 family peptidyl-tRNA hydrolase